MPNGNKFKNFSLESADQIGVVVENIERVIDFYQDVLGFNQFVQPEISYNEVYYYGERVNSRWRMAFCALGEVELELIQPISKPTIYHDFLEEKGEGLHHLGFIVSNFDELIKRSEKLDIDIIQQGEGETSRFAYLETRQSGGVIYEIIERKVKRV